MSYVSFKYKLIDHEGEEQGFFSSKGEFDGEALHLEEQSIPMAAVLRAKQRFNRLVLTYLGAQNQAHVLGIAITSKNADGLAREINGIVSRQIIDLRREALAEEGREEELAYEECPQCNALVDLTGLDESDEVYCTYCETISNTEESHSHDLGDYAICEECGYFARPNEYTIFYFYFLLVIYGWRHQKRYMCSGCMRSEAWKMLAGNFLFIIGLPVALYQLVRVYFGATNSTYPQLASANVASQKGQFDSAADSYRQMLDQGPATVGLHYNLAMNEIEAGQQEAAADHIRDGLDLCSNHHPIHDLADWIEVDIDDSDDDDALDRDIEDDIEFADVEW